MEKLDCVYLSNIPFHQDILHRPICAMSYITIVHMEHMMSINRYLALVISFYSGYEGASKAISVHQQVTPET